MLHNLRLAIGERFGTQLTFAKAAKIHPVRLNKILNGWIEATPEERARLAALLDAEQSWLFTEGARIPRSMPRPMDGSGQKIFA